MEQLLLHRQALRVLVVRGIREVPEHLRHVEGPCVPQFFARECPDKQFHSLTQDFAEVGASLPAPIVGMTGICEYRELRLRGAENDVVFPDDNICDVTRCGTGSARPLSAMAITHDRSREGTHAIIFRGNYISVQSGGRRTRCLPTCAASPAFPS